MPNKTSFVKFFQNKLFAIVNGTLEWVDEKGVITTDSSEGMAGESTSPNTSSNIAKTIKNDPTEEKLCLCFKASSWIRGKCANVLFAVCEETNKDVMAWVVSLV